MKYEPKIGYWFSAGDMLPHNDGRKIVVGEKLSVKGKLVICKNALHGSFDPFDALRYAPGDYLHRCLFSGARIEESDKLGSRSRTVLARMDATEMLRLFARRQALSVIHLWNAPKIVRRYLKTGDETIRAAAHTAAHDAAHDAAHFAAHSAAHFAASAAAHAAAHFAAHSAAHFAARSAARDAAHAAAHAAADAAADAADRKMFNEMVDELFGEPSCLNG